MTKNFKKIFWIVVGISCILIGLSGIFLPGIQGFIFILIGLWILSMVSITMKNIMNSVRNLFPSKFKEKIIQFEEKMNKKIGHWFR